MKTEIKNRWTGDVIKTVEGPLRSADLHGADLEGADLHGADLHGAYLEGAYLRNANLVGANLGSADLGSANLVGAYLEGADLHGAYLRSADLSYANLRGANLVGADLEGADLSSANLSQCKGIKTAKEYLAQFERDQLGIFVYRSHTGQEAKPEGWKNEAGFFLEEVPNPDRGTEYGSGVNFATLAWCKANYDPPFWKCRIRWEDLADVVVPFHTDGGARCARLELIEIVK